MEAKKEDALARHSRKKILRRIIHQHWTWQAQAKIAGVLVIVFLPLVGFLTLPSLVTWPHENATLVQATVTGPYYSTSRATPRIGYFAATLDSGMVVDVTVMSTLRVWNGNVQLGRVALSGVPEFPKGSRVILQQGVSHDFDRRRYAFVAFVAENGDRPTNSTNILGKP